MDDWSLFPARAYLDQHYGEIFPETATMMSAIVDYVRDRDAGPAEQAIEVAGGPTVFSLLALTAALGTAPRRIVFTDIAHANLAEVDDWLRDRPEAFDYSHLYAWLDAEVGVDPERVAAALRAADWELVQRDWREPPPRPWVGAFDVVSSHFFVESATHDVDTARTFARNYASVGRGDALVLLSFLQHATLWDCHGFTVRCLGVREGMIEDFLSNVGLTLADAQVRSAAGRRPADVAGYAGVVTVSGARVPAGQHRVAAVA